MQTFKVMSIHLPASLMFTRATRFWLIPICGKRNERLISKQFSISDWASGFRSMRTTLQAEVTIQDGSCVGHWGEPDQNDMISGGDLISKRPKHDLRLALSELNYRAIAKSIVVGSMPWSPAILAPQKGKTSEILLEVVRDIVPTPRGWN